MIDAPTQFGEPGWRVTRTDRRISLPSPPVDRKWLATAFYSGYVPCSPGVPQPQHCHQAEGSTETQARNRVMALCRADAEWPLIHGETDPTDLFSYYATATATRPAKMR
jgi:hypothetical protein